MNIRKPVRTPSPRAADTQRDIDSWERPEQFNPFYKPDLGGYLRGFPMSVRQVEGQFGPYEILTFSLTDSAQAYSTSDTLGTLSPGDLVDVVMTAQLQSLKKLLGEGREIYLAPMGKADIGNKRQAWQWDIRINPNVTGQPNTSIQQADQLPF